VVLVFVLTYKQTLTTVALVAINAELTPTVQAAPATATKATKTATATGIANALPAGGAKRASAFPKPARSFFLVLVCSAWEDISGSKGKRTKKNLL